MEEQQEKKRTKRRVRQLYFGKRDDRLWEWIQSMPDGEGNAEICQILNYYLFGGVKPNTFSYWDVIEKRVAHQTESKSTVDQNKRVKDMDLDNSLMR